MRCFERGASFGIYHIQSYKPILARALCLHAILKAHLYILLPFAISVSVCDSIHTQSQYCFLLLSLSVYVMMFGIHVCKLWLSFAGLIWPVKRRN